MADGRRKIDKTPDRVYHGRKEPLSIKTGEFSSTSLSCLAVCQLSSGFEC